MQQPFKVTEITPHCLHIRSERDIFPLSFPRERGIAKGVSSDMISKAGETKARKPSVVRFIVLSALCHLAKNYTRALSIFRTSRAIACISGSVLSTFTFPLTHHWI